MVTRTPIFRCGGFESCAGGGYTLNLVVSISGASLHVLFFFARLQIQRETNSSFLSMDLAVVRQHYATVKRLTQQQTLFSVRIATSKKTGIEVVCLLDLILLFAPLHACHWQPRAVCIVCLGFRFGAALVSSTDVLSELFVFINLSRRRTS